MHKKFLWTLVLLAFIGIEKNAMGAGPEFEEWNDQYGRSVPREVRAQAEALWHKIEREGHQAFHDGWGFASTLGWCDRFINFTCGCDHFHEIHSCQGGGIGWFGPSGKRNAWGYVGEHGISHSLDLEVNFNVRNPEMAWTSVRICEIGDWRVDGCHDKDERYFSVRRDLRQVPEQILAFVNAHGGWKAEGETNALIEWHRKQDAASSSERSSTYRSQPQTYYQPQNYYQSTWPNQVTLENNARTRYVGPHPAGFNGPNRWRK